jgi:hypothetical protein
MTIEIQSGVLGEFERTNDPRRIEVLADLIARSEDERALRALLGRLGDWPVREDPDAEDAVCSGLVAFGVMQCEGNQRYAFLPRHELPPGVSDLVRELGVSIPLRYLIATPKRRPG